MLWSIAAYFNPCRYRTRLANYATFRERLKTPLLTVELAFDAGFELGPGAADILVQRRGAAVLWQKERLLNVALAHLPKECEAVAWLDGDVVFGEPGWADAAERALEEWPLIQPFSAARDVLDPRTGGLGDPAPSYAATLARGAPAKATFEYGADHAPRRRLSAWGFAWAARRELLGRTGLYDACILGAGDRAIAQAAAGRFEEEIPTRMPSAAHAAHYRRWAREFHGAVGGRIGFLPGEVVHLWHGEFRDRQYGVRFDGFRDFDFDPERDVAIDAQGCWRWSSDKPGLHAFAEGLFARRREDPAA